MKTISLLPFRDLDGLKKLDLSPMDYEEILDLNSGYWLGSVASSEKENVDSFLQFISKGDLEQAAQFQDFAAKEIYAIIFKIETPGTKWRVFVIQIEELAQKVFCVTDVENIEIVPKEEPRCALEGLGKLKWKEIFKNIFPWPLKK